mmetsp:Transcript_54563/g.90899  ORF Transcript_54563/g.90899 Transcript_54563/m.90899 type:complete len:296 (-) Transcript_54563:1075-1962(-)
MTTFRRSSSLVLICIRSISLCTAISDSRSSMVICNCAFRFSNEYNSLPRFIKILSRRLTCNFNTSWFTISCSLFFVSFPSSTWQDSFSNVNSKMMLFWRFFSVVFDSTVILLCRTSSSTLFTCRSNTLYCFCRSSSIVCSMSIFSFNSFFSSSVRSPFARFTLRSICCTWNSILYRSSCCLKVSWSNWFTFASIFLFCACAPEISASKFASDLRTLNNSWDFKYCSSFNIFISRSNSLKVFSVSVSMSLISLLCFSKSVAISISFCNFNVVFSACTCILLNPSCLSFKLFIKFVF